MERYEVGFTVSQSPLVDRLLNAFYNHNILRQEELSW